MSEIKVTITEQLRQLQMLTHRAAFYGFVDGRARSPHRGQGRVLAVLGLKPEISQKELTYLLGMSRQALAQLLDKLEKSGYITREPSEEDRRVSIVRLTDEGRKAAAGGAEEETAGSPDVLDCLNEEELAAFSDYLARIIGRYEEQFPDEDFEERRRAMEEFMSRHGHGHGRGRGGHGEHQGRGGFGGYDGHSRRDSCGGCGGYGGYDGHGRHDGFGGYGGPGKYREHE
jgi:DNA-binding MarR family transcriptional regulator